MDKVQYTKRNSESTELKHCQKTPSVTGTDAEAGKNTRNMLDNYRDSYIAWEE